MHNFVTESIYLRLKPRLTMGKDKEVCNCDPTPEAETLVRESHFYGVTWQVGQRMFDALGGSISPFSTGGHVLQTLFPKLNDGGMSYPQCLCTASCFPFEGWSLQLWRTHETETDRINHMHWACPCVTSRHLVGANMTLNRTALTRHERIFFCLSSPCFCSVSEVHRVCVRCVACCEGTSGPEFNCMTNSSPLVIYIPPVQLSGLKCIGDPIDHLSEPPLKVVH